MHSGYCARCFVVKVYIEVGRLVNAKVELLILDLVPTKGLPQAWMIHQCLGQSYDQLSGFMQLVHRAGADMSTAFIQDLVQTGASKACL